MPQLPDATVWVKSVVEEPLNIDVNWVRTKVTFSYDTEADLVFYQSGEVKSKWLLTRTHFVIARSVATWQSRRASGVCSGDEIAALRSQ